MWRRSSRWQPPLKRKEMNKEDRVVIGGVVYIPVEDGGTDCPADCAISDLCMCSGGAPCQMWGPGVSFVRAKEGGADDT